MSGAHRMPRLSHIHFMNVPDDDLSRLDRMDGVGSPRRRMDAATGREYKPEPLDALADPTDAELDAAAAAREVGHHSTVLPPTSEKVNPKTVTAYWFGFATPVLIGLLVWSVSILTGVL